MARHRGPGYGRSVNPTRRELLAAGASGAAAVALAGPLARVAAGAARPKLAPHALGLTSLTTETRVPGLPVEGEVPDWLSGILLRNGPALFEVGERTFNHWFDGLAMLHAFSFGAGRVNYANRFLRSSAYTAWKDEGAIRYSEFGTDPCRSTFSGVASIPIIAPVPNANVSIEALGRRVVAHTEIPIPVRFSPETLRTIGVSGTPPQGRTGTAHPHHDRATGERFAYEIDLAAEPGYRVFADRRGKRRELAAIARAKPCYLHSFALTRHHVVILEQPWVVDPASFLTGPPRAIAEHYAWDPSLPSRLLVVDRRGGGLTAEVELEPMFVFHHVNATERKGRLLLDVCSYPDADVVDALALKRLRSTGLRLPRARLQRIAVDLDRRRATVRDLAEHHIELPRLDYDRRSQRSYRYVYGIGVSSAAAFSDQLVKVDVHSGDATIWRERGAYPGEPIFVRAPRARREDDGVLLSVVLDAAARTSYLLILDAATLHERARAVVPHHVPFGFHGIYRG